MNKGRWASVRLVARRSVTLVVDVSFILVSLRWSAINRLNLRLRPDQVYWSREQFGKIERCASLRKDQGQKHPKRHWYSWAWDTWTGKSTGPIWLFGQLSSADAERLSQRFFQNSRDELQRPLSNADRGVGGSGVIESGRKRSKTAQFAHFQTHSAGSAKRRRLPCTLSGRSYDRLD